MFIEPFNISFFSITGWGIDLDYHDIEWFALETNRDHSVVFEIASKYCILDSFADHYGYSISSEGFLPTVVNMMALSTGGCNWRTQRGREELPHVRGQGQWLRVPGCDGVGTA